MGFLAAFTLFGWDIGGFFGHDKKSKNVLRSISFLQTFKTLSTDTEPQPIASEIELMQLTQTIASRIGQQEILSVSSQFIPQGVAKEVASVSMMPNALSGQESVVDIEDMLEVPKTIAEIVWEK